MGRDRSGRTSETSSEFDALRERILAVGRNGKAREGAAVVFLLSRVSGEGVTSATIGLAKSIGRVGNVRTLIIDHDLGRDGIAPRLGVTSRVLDLRDVEEPSRCLEERVSTVDGLGCDLLTLEGVRPEFMAAESVWASCFNELRRNYDVILVDAGCLHAPTFLRWGAWAHQTLLVVDTTCTTEKALQSLGRDLHLAGCSLTGVILNKRSYPVPAFLYRWMP